MNASASIAEQALVDRFLADNRLFLGPDPELMLNHAIAARSPLEERLLSGPIDNHKLAQVRGMLSAALDEAFVMVEQMGAAPGAKWGDMVTAIYTTSGDLSMIAPTGVVAFAGCCHYPVKFIIKYWTDDPTVGVREGDGFIHNDARYGGIHNTDQSMMMPVFWQGEIVCWVSSTIHEGENGACEPGGMPAAAESRYDEGIKMSPFKIVEDFHIRRDLLTFLQNSVRDPKLQLEDMKVKLHVVLRLRERVLALLDQYGRDAVITTLRKNLEDTETEVRRRVAELPDGTTRVVTFMDSTLRENALQKLIMSVTIKGDQMTIDFRGSTPAFMNRSVNTNIASFKAVLVNGFVQNVWPDLPHNMSVLSPVTILSDENSIIHAIGDMPQAMSLMPLFKACTIPTVPMVKFNFSLPHRYTAVIAPQYDQAATFIYGGLNQHGDVTGNFCADINGAGQGGRSHADGEHAVSPMFGFMCDTGEHEIAEEDTPIVRLGAQVIAKDRVGFGKYRGGMGYEQIATSRGSSMWGFMTGCEGSKFSSAQGLFGGYSCPAYQLCKVKGINVFDVLEASPDQVSFDIISLMNEQAMPGATYSSHDMGMTFELAAEGEIYMICQGSGGGYGDVLERDPELVMKDVREDLLSHELAEDIYFVVYDRRSLVVDVDATEKQRDVERRARLQRSRPYDEFVEDWVKPEPPDHLPYYGSWDDPTVILAGKGPHRPRMPADRIQPQMMPHPKDVAIGGLEAENTRLRKELARLRNSEAAASAQPARTRTRKGKA